MGPGDVIERLESTDSTNAEALRRLQAGASPPFWITARRQTAGRGRRGRAWTSLEGNLFLTGVRRFAAPPAEVAQLGFAAALAVGEVAAGYAPSALIALKWPNDVLMDGRKVSGILLESQRGGHGIDLVLGVGINLVAAPDAFEPDAPKATFIAAHQSPGARAPDAEEAGARFVAAYERWRQIWAAQGFAPLRRAWLDRASGLGAPILARVSSGAIEGRFAGLDDDGSLVLEGVSGRRLVRAGEVFFPNAEA